MKLFYYTLPLMFLFANNLYGQVVIDNWNKGASGDYIHEYSNSFDETARWYFDSSNKIKCLMKANNENEDVLLGWEVLTYISEDTDVWVLEVCTEQKVKYELTIDFKESEVWIENLQNGKVSVMSGDVDVTDLKYLP